MEAKINGSEEESKEEISALIFRGEDSPRSLFLKNGDS